MGVSEPLVDRRAAISAAAAIFATPLAANASPGSYIQGTAEAKEKNTMNGYLKQPLPKETVEVARKNVYTNKKTMSYQLTGKVQKK